MDDENKGRSSSFLHPLMSIFIPFMFLFTLNIFLQASVLSRAIPSLSFGFYLLVFVVGVAESVIGRALYKAKVGGFLPRLRELVIILVMSLVVLMMTQGYLFKGDVNPLKPDVLYGLAMIAIQWALSYIIHRVFETRDLILRILAGKDGDDLRKAIHEMSVEVSQSERNLNGIKKLLLSLQALIFLAFIVLLASVSEIKTFWPVLAFLYTAINICFLVIISEFIEEQLHNADGHMVKNPYRRVRAMSFLSVFLLVILIVTPLVGKRSVLPASLISDFYNYLIPDLERRTTVQTRERNVEEEEEEEPEEQQGLAFEKPDLDAVTADDEMPLSAIIARYVIYGILILSGLLFIFFVVRPLFSKDFWRELRKAHPLRALKQRLALTWRNLKLAVQNFRKYLMSPKMLRRSISDGWARLRDSAGSRTRERRDTEKISRAARRKLNQVIKDFVRLINWGEKRGVSFEKHIGPLAYATMLCETVPEQKELLVEVGDLFEEIVYSRHAIEQKTTEYQKKIKTVLRHRREH